NGLSVQDESGLFTVTNPCISPSPTPNLTSLSLTVLLHGIGNSGDNANPSNSNGSNKNPVRLSDLAEISLLDSNNKLVPGVGGGVPALGMLKYNNEQGNFQGLIDLGGLLRQ